MSENKTEDLSETVGRELGPHYAFALAALREGGLDVSRPEIQASVLSGFPLISPNVRKTEFGYEIFVAKNEHGYELGMYIGPTPESDPERPLHGMVNITLELPGSINARVLLTRRTDGGGWSAQAWGTMSLPIGHPLGELAHEDRFLGLGRNDDVASPDIRTVEKALMEMARIFERTIH